MEEIKVRREFRVPPLLLKTFQDAEIRKKILITLGIVIIYRLFMFMPLPGLNIKAMSNFFNDIARTGSLSDWAATRQMLSIFALGLMPYLFSCIIIMLLGVFVPFLREFYIIGGQENRGKIVSNTYYLTIILSSIEGFFIALRLENPNNFPGVHIVTSPGWGFRIMTVISLTAGLLLLLWLANLITKYGIGNGVAILVIFGIIARFPGAIFQLIEAHRNFVLLGNQLFLISLIAIVLIAIIWFITKSGQKIPIIFNNLPNNHYITLRFSWTGRTPIMFTQAIASLPITIMGYNAVIQFTQTIWYTIIFYALIIFFTYFFVAAVFRTDDIVDNMKKYNCRVKDVELSKETENYLNNKMIKNTMVTALFLIVIAAMPIIYNKMFRGPYSILGIFGIISGTSLMLIIGVFYDLKEQLESYFKMKEDYRVDRWEVAYVALDEIEAELKKGFLETRGIPCTIEPLRFTWGIPIKTAVDQYRLYVPNEKLKESKEILT